MGRCTRLTVLTSTTVIRNRTSAQSLIRHHLQIIIGLHSLPGGVNYFDISEGFGHDAWFFNTTILAYSFKTVDVILSLISTSGHISSLTLAPINEVSGNLGGFGSATGLSINATNWTNAYINGCLAKIASIDKRIPLTLQDCFQGDEYWSSFYAASTNLVIDTVK